MKAVSIVLVLSAIGAVAADEPSKDEVLSLAGQWSAVGIKLRGNAAPATFVHTFKSSFEEKTYSNRIENKVVEKGNYTVDDTKSPKTIDFAITEGEDKGKQQLGIYKIEGKKLTLVIAEMGLKERPKSFKVKRGDRVLEVVLERAE